MTQVSEVPAAPAVVAPAVHAVPAAPVAATPAAPVVVVPPVQPAPPGQPAASAVPAAQGAPAAYTDFKAPEGMQANKDLVAAFVPIAKELGLTQEAAQRLVTFQMEAMKGDIAAYDAKIQAEFDSRNALTAKDPVLGGADTVSKVANAQRAIAAFPDADLKALVESKETSAKDYLTIMRWASRIGAAIKEDSMAGTHGSASGDDVAGESPAQKFYRLANKPNTKPAA